MNNAPCLINQSDCGRVAGNPVCPKCGMDERVVYPGQADREAAQAAALARYMVSKEAVKPPLPPEWPKLSTPPVPPPHPPKQLDPAPKVILVPEKRGTNRLGVGVLVLALLGGGWWWKDQQDQRVQLAEEQVAQQALAAEQTRSELEAEKKRAEEALAVQKAEREKAEADRLQREKQIADQAAMTLQQEQQSTPSAPTVVSREPGRQVSVPGASGAVGNSPPLGNPSGQREQQVISGATQVAKSQEGAPSGQQTTEAVQVAPKPSPAKLAPSVGGRWVGASSCSRGRVPVILNVSGGEQNRYTLSLVGHLNLKQNMEGEMVFMPQGDGGILPKFVVRFQDDRGMPIKNDQRFLLGRDGSLRAEAESGKCAVVLWPASSDQSKITADLSGRWAADLDCPKGNRLAQFDAVRLSSSEYRLAYTDTLNGGVTEGRLLLFDFVGGVPQFVSWNIDDRFVVVKDGQTLELIPSGQLKMDASVSTRQCNGIFHRD